MLLLDTSPMVVLLSEILDIIMLLQGKNLMQMKHSGLHEKVITRTQRPHCR